MCVPTHVPYHPLPPTSTSLNRSVSPIVLRRESRFTPLFRLFPVSLPLVPTTRKVPSELLPGRSVLTLYSRTDHLLVGPSHHLTPRPVSGVVGTTSTPCRPSDHSDLIPVPQSLVPGSPTPRRRSRCLPRNENDSLAPREPRYPVTLLDPSPSSYRSCPPTPDVPSRPVPSPPPLH